MLQGWGIEAWRGRAAGRWIVCLGVYNADRGLVTWINVYLWVGGGHRRMLVDSVCEIIWDQMISQPFTTIDSTDTWIFFFLLSSSQPVYLRTFSHRCPGPEPEHA